ncbi:MAG: F0F1 ATP synthase subunit A [Anaerolineales bacterium]|nr:F0F1 ATP synthase subunit A [Anaerolineales bacterium]
MTTHAAPQRRFGFWRWVWLALMILGGYLAFVVGGIWKPVPPAVVLPAEPAWPGLYLAPGLPFTNTMLSALLASLVFFVPMLLAVQGFVRGGSAVPSGFYQVVEMAVEFFWNTTQSAAGKWAKRIFPFTMTIFLYVLAANLFKMLPIHETIGYTKVAHGNVQGYSTVVVGGIHLLDGSHPYDAAAHAGEAGHSESAGGEAEAKYWNSPEPCENCEVVPSIRGAATDLNFTAALALVTMLMVQIFGVWALGLDYFSKFFNLKTIISKPFFGLMDFIVGLLELISEIAKILSFSLRLFGVIFAGTLLLAILGSMTAVFVPGLLVGLELFVGIIQAYVFSTLALTFMSQATVSHHGDEHSEEAH